MLNTVISIGAREFFVHRRASHEDSILLENENAVSYIDHSASRIVIRDDGDLSDDSFKELVIHEIMHAIVKNSGLDQCLKDGFDEEFLVSALAPRVHELIKRNNLESLLRYNL